MADQEEDTDNTDNEWEWEVPPELYVSLGSYRMGNEKLPIQGPPNLFDIWPIGKIGEDVEEEAPGEKEARMGQQPDNMIALPLYEYQFDLCRSHKIKDVNFDEYLGSGCFGSVWVVDALYRPDTSIKEWTPLRFACKVIRYRTGGDYSGINNALEEMRIIQNLSHENICNIADAIGIRDRVTRFPYSVICLILEYCHGNFFKIWAEGTPQDWDPQREWTLPENLSRHWFAQVMRGLAYIHRQGVFHDDIKGDNILYRYRRAVDPNMTYEERFLAATFKLADFGVSEYHISLSFGFKREDLSKLSSVFFEAGVLPFAQGIDVDDNIDEFVDFYDTDQLKYGYPQEWLNYSNTFKHFVSQLKRKERLMASEILSHPWLQNNNEEETEPFIVRAPPNTVFQPEKVDQYERYGQRQRRHRILDKPNFEWIFRPPPLPSQIVPYIQSSGSQSGSQTGRAPRNFNIDLNVDINVNVKR